MEKQGLKRIVKWLWNNAQLTTVQWLTIGVILGAMLASFSSMCFMRTSKIFVLGCMSFFSIGVIGFNLYKREYLRKKRYVFGLTFALWFFIVSCIHGTSVWVEKDNMFLFIWLCIVCGAAFPFAEIMKDNSKRQMLDLISFLTILGFAVLLWCSYIALIRGENISLIGGRVEFGATYTYTGRMMLQVLKLSYYGVGRVSVICFFVTIYLAAAHWSRRIIIPLILFELTFTMGIILTYSRNCIFTFVGGLLMTIYCLLQKLSISKKSRWILMVVLCCLAVPITLSGMNVLYKLVHSIRDVWYGITTLTSRTEVWEAVLKVVRDQPQVLIWGMPLEEIPPAINSYLDLNYIYTTHNGYLQTLLTMGLPGVIAVVCFTVKTIISSCRIFFTTSEQISTAHKLMVLVPAVLLVMNLVVSQLFVRYTAETEISNIFLALFAGYIMEIEDEFLPKRKKNAKMRG